MRQLGTWAPHLATTPTELYSAAVAPFNITTPKAAAAFDAYAAHGWQTYGTSPFVRGWELERLASERGQSISTLADLMLRYAAFGANVDLLIVSMRNRSWYSATPRVGVGAR